MHYYILTGFRTEQNLFYSVLLQDTTHTKEKCVLLEFAQGWTNRTLAVHERVISRFLVLPGSLCIFTPDYWAQIF